MTAKDRGYGSIPTSSAPTNVQVIAPATLNAGYTFDAMYSGVTFTVVVPEGGVVKGQRFIVPFLPPAATTPVAVGEPITAASKGAGGSVNSRPRRNAQNEIPTGVWRDNLCDCCRFGPCHPHFLCAWLCRPILIGQLLTRMKMTWLGQRIHLGNSNCDRVEVGQWKKTFRNMVIITVLYYVIMLITAPDKVEQFDTPISITVDGNEYTIAKDVTTDENTAMSIINSLTSTLFFLYVLYVLIQLRATLRHVYSIPEESCLCMYGILGNSPRDGICGNENDTASSLCTARVPIGWEDVCCAFWCPLCIAGQMARHTVDYKERRAHCCDDAGVEGWEEEEAFLCVEGGDGFVGEGSALVY